MKIQSQSLVRIVGEIKESNPLKTGRNSKPTNHPKHSQIHPNPGVGFGDSSRKISMPREVPLFAAVVQ